MAWVGNKWPVLPFCEAHRCAISDEKFKLTNQKTEKKK
jgi:hypothetical protein